MTLTQPLPCEIRLTVTQHPSGLTTLRSDGMPGLHVAVSGDPALSGGATVFDELPTIINGLHEAVGLPAAKVIVDRDRMVAVLTAEDGA